MKLTDSSAARVGNSIVRAISSITTSLRHFFVYTDLAISSAISGAVGAIKEGLGVLTFSATNTYSGNTTINAGTLSITSTAALPGWNVNGRYSVESGATLAVYNAVVDADVVTMLATTNFKANSAIGFDTTSGNRTYPNVVANTAQGVLGLTKVGSNTLTISGANTYTGPTLVIAGTLSTSTSNRIPDASAVTILAGAIITLGGADTFATLAGAGTLTCGANSLKLNSANSATFSGTLTNTAGTFFKSGTGTQTLAGSTTVAANVRLDGGGIISSGTFLQTAAAGSRNFQIALAGGTTAALTVSGGTMTVTGLFFGENNGGSATVNVNAGTLQVNGETWMAGLLSTLNVNGGTFNGSSYDIGGGSGTTTSIINITSGIFALTGNLRWGIGSATSTSVINLDGGTFSCANWFRNNGTNTFNFNGGTFTTNTNNLTITQPLISCLIKSGGAVFSLNTGITLIFDTSLQDAPGVNGNIVKNGAGTLIMSRANSNTGSVTINAGTLQMGNGASGGFASSSEIINNANFSINRSANLNQGANFPLISGTGNVIHLGTGITSLLLSNTYTGETLINAGTLRLSHQNGFGFGNIRFNGGTMQYGSGISTDVSARIVNNSSAIRIDTNSQNVNFTSLPSSNTGGLIKTGVGTLTLSGASNNYGGTTTISAGTMEFSGTYTANGAININGSASPILNITGTLTQTFTGSGVRGFQLSITAGNTSTVNISGSAVVSFGAGMMLGDNGGGSGTMNVSGGTVNSNGGVWFAGSTSVMNISGGTFTSTTGTEIGGGSGTTTSTLNVSGTGTINLNSLIFNRGATTATSIINLNGGTLTLTGITHLNTPTSVATINFNSGVYSIQNTQSIPSTVSTIVKSGGAIINTPGAFALTINGALTTDGTGGGVTKQGTGTLNLNGTNTYTGSTSITAGTLVVASAGFQTNTGGKCNQAKFTNTTITANFTIAPTIGDTFKFFIGATTQTGLSVTLTGTGVTGRSGTYDSSTSTLTIT